MRKMDNKCVEAYLTRLKTPTVHLDAAGLASLQAAHLMAVPFHNLLLLANDGRPWGLQPLGEVVQEAIDGVGGNCDRTTPPFTALLQAVGFDAHLAAATVREPGDHFVCVAHAEGRRFLCDVGNGHPYLHPWDLDGPVQEQSFQGWHFRFNPVTPNGPTLFRILPDSTVKTVYTVDLARRAYEDFAPMVTAHYTKAGFGPFLGSLRAVSIQPDVMLTLRDGAYARDTRFGRTSRSVAGRDAFRSLLTNRFCLPPSLVDSALAVLARRRPELFAEPRWFALGRGKISESAGVAPPERAAVPDVLVSLATVGRETAVRRLLQTLAEEVRASHYPGRIGVLIVENHDPKGGERDPDPEGLTVHRIGIESTLPAIHRAARLGLLPEVGDRLPLPIGAAREAQLAALRAHLDSPVQGLPHPSDRPLVVWMVDDDIAFQQVDAEGQVGRHTHLLFRAARLWSELPQHSVVLGTFTGDPPIPGIDSLGGQLRDLASNVSRMLTLGPEAAYQPPIAPPPTFDAYYDLSEAKGVQESAVWPYAPYLAGVSVREVACALLRDLPRLLDGQQLTRALVWDGTDLPPRPSLRRGGNTLFLDIDALFRWPTPALATPDGVTTRRADTVWAALAQAEDPGVVVETTLPVLHGREGQATQPGMVATTQAGHHAASQVRGVVLARAIAEGRDVARELANREAKVRSHRLDLRTLIEALRRKLRELEEWTAVGRGAAPTPELGVGLSEAKATLDALDQLVSASDPLPGDPTTLSAFLSHLPEAVRVWRGGW